MFDLNGEASTARTKQISAITAREGLRSSTPELNGAVVGRSSADVTQDAKTGASYYTVRITVANQQPMIIATLLAPAGLVF
jgi:hypothetical protein